MSPLLEIRGLTVRFPGSHAGAPVVRDVFLTVHSGETVALVGESGSGKTVTALAVMGLLPPGTARVEAASSIRVAGSEVVGAAPESLRRLRGGTVGMVFQDASGALNPVRRVGSQLREVLERHGTSSAQGAEEKARALLVEAGLQDPARVADAFPHQLSGGMRQRALLSLALAGEPRLLLADEPTSALDACVRLRILERIRALTRSRELGTLLITHDFGVVAHVADRVAVMYAGEVVETGPVDRVLGRPAHPYTRGLLAALPGGGRPKEPLQAIPGRIPPPGERSGGCLFAERCPGARDRCAVAPAVGEVGPGEGTVRCWYPLGDVR